MKSKNDILTLEDIKLLVDSFYARVRKDDLLGPIFNEKIGNKWPEHLEKLSRFWQTILLQEHTYYGSPFAPHAELPVDKNHFDRWLYLFFETVDENFTGEKAKEAKTRAEKMAQMFYSKISYYRQNNSKPLI